MTYQDTRAAGSSVTRLGSPSRELPTHSGEAIGFSRLEWDAVALAKRDGPRSLAPPGPVSRMLRALFGVARDSRLADPRLETLRRAAVVARHEGNRLPLAEVAAFYAAGFSRRQLQTLMTAIEANFVPRANARLAGHCS